LPQEIEEESDVDSQNDEKDSIQVGFMSEDIFSIVKVHSGEQKSEGGSEGRCNVKIIQLICMVGT